MPKFDRLLTEWPDGYIMLIRESGIERSSWIYPDLPFSLDSEDDIYRWTYFCINTITFYLAGNQTIYNVWVQSDDKEYLTAMLGSDYLAIKTWDRNESRVIAPEGTRFFSLDDIHPIVIARALTSNLYVYYSRLQSFKNKLYSVLEEEK